MSKKSVSKNNSSITVAYADTGGQNFEPDSGHPTPDTLHLESISPLEESSGEEPSPLEESIRLLQRPKPVVRAETRERPRNGNSTRGPPDK